MDSFLADILIFILSGFILGIENGKFPDRLKWDFRRCEPVPHVLNQSGLMICQISASLFTNIKAYVSACVTVVP